MKQAKKILLVDDEPGMLRYIKTLLELDEFAVETASTGEEALELLKGGSEPDLVLLDLLMPGIDGLQTLEQVRQLRPSVKVIMLSCVTDTRKVVQAIRLGASDYLTKPFQIAHLQKIVTRCLESKGLLRMSEEALRESLGAAIRERRKALGLTLAQMAQRTSVSLGYLSQIELGKNSASIETLYRISLGLGVKIADLFQAVQVPS